jgi:ATP citrate (pro-S)-lyase
LFVTVSHSSLSYALFDASDLSAVYSTAYDRGLTPQEFVDTCRKDHKLILGIGHLVKSATNPDMRVTILKVDI